jgi:hypothetical protein
VEYCDGCETVDVDGLENNNESADGKRRPLRKTEFRNNPFRKLPNFSSSIKCFYCKQSTHFLTLQNDPSHSSTVFPLQTIYLKLDTNTPPLFRHKLIHQFNPILPLTINLPSPDTLFIF